MSRRKRSFPAFAGCSGLVLLLVALPIRAQEKQIRLRQETIRTPPPAATGPALAPLAVPQPVSGLFLVQSEGPLAPASREALRQLGVRLLRYVPDDAFVARLEQADPARIRASGLVRWLGPYRPSHKLMGPPPSSTTAQVRVRVLLAPDAAPAETVRLRRSLRAGSTITRSRFGAVLRAEVPAAQLEALSQSDAVLWIEPDAHPELFDEIATKIVAGDDGEAGTQAVVHQLGFDGDGVRVAVADSGLQNGDAESMHPDLAGRVDGFFHYGSLLGAADEHSHGTHVTGIIAGNGATGETDEAGYLYGLGVAPRARIVAQRIFDGAGNYEPPESFEQLTTDAVRAGAVIGSNSWGDDTQGRYDMSAQKFDELVRDADPGTPGLQPYILEFSAGNAGPGPQTIGSPAVAKNVIATGASQNNRPDLFIYAEGEDAMADFSSRGPCEDGRIKPDVVAPGTWIASLKSASATDENAWAPISENYLYQGGTSQAGPQVSGAAAVFVQYYRETHGGATPSPALVKAALINGAIDMDDAAGTAPAPNMDEGWGRIDLTSLIGSARQSVFHDQESLLTLGQTNEQRLVVASTDLPLRITLAYTDVPGFPPAIPALVNDLDLEVVAPDGRVYHGNQMLAGESVPDAAGRDSLNNVEAVHLAEPLAGEYQVRVIARNVVDDARIDTPAIDQDFALVASGRLPAAGAGVVFLDRQAYPAPARIKVKLLDAGLAGQPHVDVRLTSTTEVTPEVLRLTASNPKGDFTNSIAVVLGAPVPDGRLQVANGDIVEAAYDDASPTGTRLARAAIDLDPPVATAVSVTNRFGRGRVTWTTDEPTSGVVRYGTNGLLSFAVTNTVAQLSHELLLADLIAGQAYQFVVISTDLAGNTSTNDNGGQRFEFVARGPEPVLLVNAYVYDPENDPSLEIPLTSYTDALDQSGFPYEIWDLTQPNSPSPTADDLALFRVVLWRINDSFYESRGLSEPEQNAIQTYLSRGGSFFMASMEIISRVGAAAFRTNVLQVGEFEINPDPFGVCLDCDEDHGVPAIVGSAGDPLSADVDLVLDYSSFPVMELEPLFPNVGPDLGDTFLATTNAVTILTEPNSGRAAGVRSPRVGQDVPGRVVFFSFPLEALPETGSGPNTRAALLRKALAFLAPDLGGLATVGLDQPVYTVPSQMVVEVADAAQAGRGRISASIASTLEPSPRILEIQETARRGLFRGWVSLALPGEPSRPGQWRVRNGDSVTVEYVTPAKGDTVRAQATVDTVLPVLTDLDVVPDYESAEVSWSSSKLTDALVQFGESSFLERTAYRAAPAASHALTLSGLRPGRTYYYQVVSRDAAGNTVVDDNLGRLHTFQTLQPLTPPWGDDLDTGATNWTVIDGDGSQSSWRLGPPANGLEPSAHSPPNAWGSHLGGESTDLVDTFLISPAIDLTGGNVASLRFWHSYDFQERTSSDLWDVGALLVVTNAATAPVTVAEFSDVSGGWTEDVVDLTPFLGRVIFLVWHHQILAFESAPRAGWLVDDVSVSVDTETRATLLIGSNLKGARFTLDGPVNRTGVGSLNVTNAPLGQYTVRFQPVTGFLTPPDQTRLAEGAEPLLFSGFYSYVDLNTNGMPDTWEQQFFGEVTPGRTPQTDTDLDGATDQAEFVAGTSPIDDKSVLVVEPPQVLQNGWVKLSWHSVPGRAYRWLTSADLVHWSPGSDWAVATATESTLLLPPPVGVAPGYRRIEVSP